MSSVAVIRELCDAEELLREAWDKVIRARIDFLRYLPSDWETDLEKYPPEFQDKAHALRKKLEDCNQPISELLSELSQLVKETAAFITDPEPDA